MGTRVPENTEVPPKKSGFPPTSFPVNAVSSRILSTTPLGAQQFNVRVFSSCWPDGSR